MTSKSFFKKSIPPRLYRRFSLTSAACLEIWTTTCIVTNFGQNSADQTSILVNPSNPQLSGTSNFPYFPRGGPAPQAPTSMHKDWQPLGYVSQWGGMEVGHGMLFPVSVVDGLVHLYGGWKLRMECQWHRLKNAEPCPVGTAVLTSAGNDQLAESFTHVIHTTPPFYNHDTTKHLTAVTSQLSSCYHAIMKQARIAGNKISSTLPTSRSQRQDELRMAFPLLGSGCRGFPHEIAMDIAVSSSLRACQDWSDQMDGSLPVALVFGLLEEQHARRMACIVEQHLMEEEREQA